MHLDDPDLPSLLYEILDATMALQQADYGDVQLYDEHSATLRLVAYRNHDTEFLEHFAVADANNPSTCGRALERGERVLVGDVNLEPSFEPHRAIAAKTGFRGAMSTPLLDRTSGKPLGVISTQFKKPFHPSSRDLWLADLFARQAADLIRSRMVERQLRESEEFFRLALEAAGMGTWEWSVATNLIKADEPHRALYGMPPNGEPVRSDVYLHRMDPLQSGMDWERALSALRTGADIKIDPPNGEQRWIAIRGRPRQNDHGTIIGISYDITEPKEREESLRDHKEWLSAILDQLPGGVGLFDVHGKAVLRGGPLATLWSDRMPSEDPESRSHWRAFGGDGQPLPFNRYPGARALTGEFVSPGIDFLHTKPGETGHWYRVSSAPFRDEQGAITGATVFMQDVDKEKRAEERLRQSEQRLKDAAELAGLGLYSIEMVDGAERLTWDDRVRALWGLPAGCEITKEIWEAGIHPDDRERVRQAVASAYDPNDTGEYEVQYRVIGADGIERWVATLGGTRFEGGRVVSFLGVVRDITDRKMIERGLELVIEMRNSELEQMSASLQAEAEARQRVDDRLEILQSELSRGLFAAIENRRPVTSSLTAQRRLTEAARKISELTPRERQVLEGLVQGEPHKTIAHRLGISVRTVELHRMRMLHRLGTPHLADAIRIAVLAELAAERPEIAS